MNLFPFLFILGFTSVALGAVYKFNGEQQLHYPGSPIHDRLVRQFHKRHNEDNFLFQRRVRRSVGVVNINPMSFFITKANVSVGTPGQSFAVEVDFFETGSLALIHPSANLTNVQTTLPAKKTFVNTSSTSYKDQNRTFSSWIGKGRIGNDILTVASTVTSAVKVFVIDTLSDWLEKVPVDGVLGLAPKIFPARQNMTSVLDQISATLDSPVVSVWTNSSYAGNGSLQGTLGALDKEHCQSNWFWVPQVRTHYDPYAIHLASVDFSIGNAVKSVGMNSTLSIYPYSSTMYLPTAFQPYFVNATKAQYNSTTGLYVVDCDTSKAGKIVMNVGGTGNTTDSTTKQLVLKGTDYIRYWPQRKICYLGVYFTYWSRRVELNLPFLDNHCIGFNTKDRKVGIADSNTPISEPKKY